MIVISVIIVVIVIIISVVIIASCFRHHCDHRHSIVITIVINLIVLLGVKEVVTGLDHLGVLLLVGDK